MLTSVSLAVAESINYGQKFDFEPSRKIEFPDFELQFVERKPGSFYRGSTSRRLGDIFEFRVFSHGTNQVLRWSSGTGDIGPGTFVVGNKCFWLKLVRSDKFGTLESGQAVVSRGETCR